MQLATGTITALEPHIFDAWIEVYIRNQLDGHKDQHDAFAARLGKSRPEAKVRCYQVMYSVPFLEELLQGLKPDNHDAYMQALVKANIGATQNG